MLGAQVPVAIANPAVTQARFKQLPPMEEKGPACLTDELPPLAFQDPSHKRFQLLEVFFQVEGYHLGITKMADFRGACPLGIK